MKKTISILLCVIFCFACFAPAAFAADKKTIKVATNVAFPPYEYYEDEKAVGIDVDIMQAICDKLGYEMELSDMEFGSRLRRHHHHRGARQERPLHHQLLHRHPVHHCQGRFPHRLRR